MILSVYTVCCLLQYNFQNTFCCLNRRRCHIVYYKKTNKQTKNNNHKKNTIIFYLRHCFKTEIHCDNLKLFFLLLSPYYTLHLLVTATSMLCFKSICLGRGAWLNTQMPGRTLYIYKPLEQETSIRRKTADDLINKWVIILLHKKKKKKKKVIDLNSVFNKPLD